MGGFQSTVFVSGFLGSLAVTTVKIDGNKIKRNCQSGFILKFARVIAKCYKEYVRCLFSEEITE